MAVYVFGDNTYGQIGETDFSKDKFNTPKALSLNEEEEEVDFTRVVAGAYHSALLDAYGQLYMFGYGNSGRLALPEDIGNVPKPTRVPGLFDVVVTQVSCGFYHSAVVTDQMRVFTFGYGSEGQLGHGDKETIAYPKEVSSLVDIVGVAAGFDHTVFMSEKGNILTCGCNSYLQLGYATVNDGNLRIPLLVEGLASANITAISAGYCYTLALSDQGQVYAFGSNSNGKLGLGHDNTQEIPALIPVFEYVTVTHIAAGGLHSVFLTEKGEVFTCGSNMYSQLGQGEQSCNTPREVISLQGLNVKSIAAGYHSTAVLTELGHLYTFGNGANGRLGHGDNADKGPTRVTGLLEDIVVQEVSLGVGHALLLQGPTHCAQLYELEMLNLLSVEPRTDFLHPHLH